MGIFEYHWVDVFSERPFGGNPLTVFPSASGLAEEEMQLLARELNHTDTVFVVPPTSPQADVRLRFFTPRKEVPLSGHPVLGAHYVLAMLEDVTLEEPVTVVQQEVGAGILPVEVHIRGKEIQKVVMSLSPPRFSQPFADKMLVEAALGIEEGKIGPGDLLPQVVEVGVPWFVIPVVDLKTIQGVRPDLEVVSQLVQRVGTDQFYLFTMETESPEATAHGRQVPFGDTRLHEDPVTGDAAGCVGAFLVRNRVLLPTPSMDLVVEQGHEVGRPGKVDVQVLTREEQVTEVKIGGPVVHVGFGRFEI